VFSEPERAALDDLARLAAADPLAAARLPAWRVELDHDRRFATALQGRPVVMGYYFSSDRGGQRAGRLPSPLFQAADLAGLRLRLPRWNGYGASLPVLADAAPRAGFFNALPDEDGVTRSLPLVAGFEGRGYASLALALTELARPATAAPRA